MRFFFMPDHGTEKLLKRLVGKKEVEDAVSRLDTLTKDENLMIAAWNLEVTHRVNRTAEATKDGTQCFLPSSSKY